MPAWIDSPPTWTPSPEEYYAADHLIGSSALKLFRRSRSEFACWLWNVAQSRQQGRVVEATTPGAAMTLGSAVDCQLTEPDAFASRFVVTDSRRPSHTGIAKLSTVQYGKVQRMAAAIREHGTARQLITGPGIRQMCHRWTVHGVEYRLRADHVSETVHGDIIVPDLKCWDIDPTDWWQVKRHADLLDTFEQMSQYGQGIADLWRPPLLCLVIVSSRPGHKVKVWHLDATKRAMQGALAEVEENQRDLAECLRAMDFRDKMDLEIGASA